ncbi:hypothetical protein TPA0910_13160 [Streptomyces hygroscopicus subsp. sporocinereus]|uniref:Uncharacterized protein n=1 Tax=Streptomyces hygroscopicus TaxID=1912 RepID=A0ABQ3TU69_STRHY|nr:hypothetical protein TPA0910_13160 [Streptomyces hygroscopicus]
MIDSSPAVGEYEEPMNLRHAGSPAAAIGAGPGLSRTTTACRMIARFVVGAHALAREAAGPEAAVDEIFPVIEAAWRVTRPAGAEEPTGPAGRWPGDPCRECGPAGPRPGVRSWMPPGCASPADGQWLKAPDDQGVPPGELVGCGVRGETRGVFQEGAEGDPAFQPGQRRAQAVVRAVPEGEVPLGVAADVEGVGTVEALRVTARGRARKTTCWPARTATLLRVSRTGGFRNDVTQFLPLVDGLPPVRRMRGRPRRKPRTSAYQGAAQVPRLGMPTVAMTDCSCRRRRRERVASS